MHSNFLKRNYKHYYAQNSEGVWEEVERLACVSYDPETSFAGKYPQRWYADFESDYLVRLNRDKAGEQLYNAVKYLRRKESKLLAEQFGYVSNDCPKCKGWKKIVDGEPKCERCPQRVVFVSLDRDTGDAEEADYLKFDSGIDVSQQCESSYLLEMFHAVLDGYSVEERKLWTCVAAEMKKKDIALMFGWTVKQLEYRESKLYAKIRSNKDLKSFLEN